MIGVCVGLAVRDQLVPVLAVRAGSREEVLLGLESMMRRMAEFDRELFDLYGSAAKLAIQSLQKETTGDGA